VSAYGLSNNNTGDGGMWIVGAIFGGLTAQVDWGGQGVLLSVYIHQIHRVNSRNNFRRDDSTINVVVVIISIIVSSCCKLTRCHVVCHSESMHGPSRNRIAGTFHMACYDRYWPVLCDCR